MLYESKAPPEFYPLAFGEKANELLQQSFHMFREDITKKKHIIVYGIVFEQLVKKKHESYLI